MSIDPAWMNQKEGEETPAARHARLYGKANPPKKDPPCEDPDLQPQLSFWDY